MSSLPNPLQENALSNDPLAKLARDSWKWIIGLGITGIVVGAVVLAWPGRTVLVVAVFFGIFLIVSGVVQLITGFASHLPGVARVLYALTGALSVLLGVICFRDDLESVLLLAVWVGTGWIMSGISRGVVALSTPSGTPGRGWTGVAGLVITLGGIILITTPIESMLSLAVVSACFLIAFGIAQVFEGFALRTATKSAPL